MVLRGLQDIESRTVVSVSMIVLSTSGIFLVWLNSLTKNSKIRRSAGLNQLLWKFQLMSPSRLFQEEQKFSLYKLLCTGIMINCIVVSLLAKLIDIQITLIVGVAFFFVWLSALLMFWRWYVKTVISGEANEPSLSDEKNVICSSSSSPFLSSWEERKALFSKNKNEDPRIRISMVTGFLGSGKTSLIKNILANTVGLRVLVIENEIGSEGIDHDLLLRSTKKEEIILLNNGCICCSVRNDLLTTFRNLFSNDAFYKIDWIIIETTGLADPAPIIQSFYMDKECQDKVKIDGVVTVVDSKHFALHLKKKMSENVGNEKETKGVHGGVSEAILQVSFADKIIFNKTDLVQKHELISLKKSIFEINSTAEFIECEHGKIDIQRILNISAFDPKRFIALNYEHQKSRSILISRDDSNNLLKKKQLLDFRKRVNPVSTSDGDIIQTISLTSEDPIDLTKFNEWVSDLLQSRGKDIYRMKGILSIAGYSERFVCHAVHMIFDGERYTDWASNEKRISKLVFIGYRLSKEELEIGFLSTLQ
jgi:G3E family GTPase